MSISHGMLERLKLAKEYLVQKGITFDTALSDIELRRIEAMYKFTFPPEMEAWLKLCMPVSKDFPNWREQGESLEKKLSWPFESIAFDIRMSDYWRAEWGPKPPSVEDAVAIAKDHVSNAPRLVPICGHSYLPAEPSIEGNPVFSVYQTDVIHRGEFLPDYLMWLRHDENDDERLPVFDPSYRYIRFWTDLARENSLPLTQAEILERIRPKTK